MKFRAYCKENKEEFIPSRIDLNKDGTVKRVYEAGDFNSCSLCENVCGIIHDTYDNPPCVTLQVKDNGDHENL